jgi:hypothetical protein
MVYFSTKNRQQFHQFLLQRMNTKTVGDRLRYAIQFGDVLQTGEASTLLQLPPDKRIHIMKTLTLLARFQGCYYRWMQIRQRYGLAWNTGNEALTAFEWFFNPDCNLDHMLRWVKEAIRVLPAAMAAGFREKSQIETQCSRLKIKRLLQSFCMTWDYRILLLHY